MSAKFAQSKVNGSSHNSQKFTMKTLNKNNNSSKRKCSAPQLIIKDKTLFKMHNNFNFSSPNKVVSFKELDEDSDEFEKIIDMITNQYLVVDEVKKVINPYLLKAYQMKKTQKQLDYPGLEEKLLFHGTKEANLMDICKYNFNWRYVKKHRFGKGVNFSTNAKYASNYSEDGSDEKYMFLAQVLVGPSCLGDSKKILPPDGYDTTTKGDGIVTVKYEDNEFYPKYLIAYHFDYEDSSDGDDESGSDDESSESGSEDESYSDEDESYSDDSYSDEYE